MSKAEKKINKWLIGAIIGTTLIGAGGLSMTPRGQSFRKRWFNKSKKLGYFLGGLLAKKKKSTKKRKKHIKKQKTFSDDNR